MAVTNLTQTTVQQPNTASNQNEYANALPQTYSSNMTQQNPSQASWQPQYPMNQGQTSNPYTSAWGQGNQQNTASPWGNQQARTQTGPFNPNPPSQPSQPSPYTPGQLSPWTPQTPAQPAYTPYTPSTTQTWTNPNNSAGTPWTPADFNTQALRDQYTAYMQASLPYMQFMQNNQQYSQDFNEAARRFDTQTQWQQQMDRYNMDLTGRQQQMQEWAQQEAANQWAAQFGWTQQNDLFSQDLANRQLDSQNWYQQAQVGLGQRQADIEQAYNEGRLSNEQRQIALAELAQSQDNAWQYFQLARQQELSREQLGQQLGFSREELAATVANQQMNYQLQMQQMAQQMEQQRLQMEADRQNAILSATGRAAGIGPSSQWMRRF